MQKLLVLFPFYRQLPVAWFFNFLAMEKEPVVGHLETDGAYLPLALEMMTKEALQNDEWDRVVIFEHDMIPPVNAFTRIATYGHEHDIVGSLYFGHEPPHHVNVCMQVGYPNFSPLTAAAVRMLKENPGLYEVDGVSTGFTSIARHVLEDWDPAVQMWMPQPPHVAHDMHFCHQAKLQGWHVFVDSGIGCGHLTQVSIGYEDSKRALAEVEPPTWERAITEHLARATVTAEPAPAWAGADTNLECTYHE